MFAVKVNSKMFTNLCDFQEVAARIMARIEVEVLAIGAESL